MTNEPMTQKKRSPWIWVSLGCIGVLAIMFILGITWFRGFMNSDEGKQMRSGMQRAESMKVSLPIVANGFQKYLTENSDFPPTLDDLKGYIDEATLQKVKSEMTYTKPSKDAPDNAVILTTGEKPFIQGSFMEVRLEKNLRAFNVTKQPLEAR